MKAVIIVNGPLPERMHWEAALKGAQRVLCADGGANRALKAGIEPDFVIGDFDSLTPESRARIAPEKLIHRPSQYAPDIEKTLQFAVERGVKHAVVLGATRGRFDHEICNLNIMEKFSDRMTVEFLDDSGAGRFVRGRWRFDAPVGQQVSIFAFRRVEGLSTRNLKYPLQDATMEWAVNDGLSNEVVATPVEVMVKKGTVLVFRVWLDG